MDVTTDKIIGYVLLVVGLILIIFAAYSMLDVFIGTREPPSILKINSITISVPVGLGAPPEKIELLSGTDVSKIANLGLWYILMFFFASIGSKIGGLGVQLIREIKVVVKGQD